MAFKIGFLANHTTDAPEVCAEIPSQKPPRKSVVLVRFDNFYRDLTYYNDRFDLHRGDLVYVDGKLEGQRGRVIEVNYSFKIKLSDYKRVIAVVDTDVHGSFCMAGSHCVTFDRQALPASKVLTWFKAPEKEGEEFVRGWDGAMFSLADPSAMNISASVAERGSDYYAQSKVRYLCLDGTAGYAIVEGSKPYEVEFTYDNGEIGELVCSCFCSGVCKHEVAVMLQLKETLELIEKNYADAYDRSGYFAAMPKSTLYAFAVGGSMTGSFTL